MADGKSYCLGDLAFAPFKIRCANGVDEVHFKVWGGMLHLEVRNLKSQDFKPVVSKSINLQVLAMILSQINKIKTASPETNLPMVFQRFDPETKHWDTDWVLGIQKDNKLVYHVTAQVKGSKYDSVLKGPGGVAYGSEPISEADKSNIALQALELYLRNDVPIQCAMTSKKKEFNPNGGGRQNGGYNNGGNNQQQPPSPPPAGTSGEDYF